MEVILRRMKNNLLASGITNKKLAIELKMRESRLSECLNGKRTFAFYSFSQILINHFTKDNTFSRLAISEYCKTIKGNINIRIALEYAHARGEFALLKLLIKKARDSKNKENHDRADVYELFYKRGMEGLVKNKLLQEVKKLKERVKTEELRILLDILQCLGSYDKGSYVLLQEEAYLVRDKIEKQINDKTGFMKESFTAKINDVIHIVDLTMGNIEQVRKYGDELVVYLDRIKMFPISQASTLSAIGESYIFDNYEKSHSYFLQALEVLENSFNEKMIAKRNRIIATLDFLKIYWDKELNTLTPIDNSEKAYFEIKKGNNGRAIKILNEIIKERDHLTAFETCYLGLAKNDKGLIQESLVMLERKGNIYYSQLPKKILGII
ncbi:hypothetical protein BAMA_15605 [Bacillus manliponensis]|uniref:Prophage helix-turn-helix protein n=1 Tax=Bacillus manliponensis TaxID=574376 RepID=A0A073K538_9BACI|nr:AimR family lysis-lysogeny pheromone receptor [Bacillus manliponensis]KEK17378.1 hypothetical protein BAMA_15605 [Bacillus manliponensis]